MTAYFVNLYTNANMLTPTSILVLFIVSVLATVWAIFTIFTYHRTRSDAHFVSFIDLCFVGAFIAAVYYLRPIGSDNCSSLSPSSFSTNLGIFGAGVTSVSPDKACGMLKASWVFGIMNCVFFFGTAVLAYFVGRKREREVYVRKETRTTTHHGGSRRSGSHRSHRSSHSGRRSHAYV
jgi:hypothetical protein